MPRTRRTYTGREVYDAIVDHFAAHDYPPSFDEIRVGAGMRSKATVKEWMHKLRTMGVVDFNDAQPRTLRVTAPWPDTEAA